MPVTKKYDVIGTDSEGRESTVTMTVGVPPHIAREIDQAMNENPYFAELYFQALYPENHIETIPTAELFFQTFPAGGRQEPKPFINPAENIQERPAAIRRRESERLGIEVPELPEELTPELLASLELEYDMHYIPPLTNLGQLRGDESTFGDWTKAHRSVTQALGEEYLRYVGSWHVELSSLEGGRWIALKKEPNPNASVARIERRNQFPRTRLLERLNRRDRLPTPYELITLPSHEGTFATRTRKHEDWTRDEVIAVTISSTGSFIKSFPVDISLKSYNIIDFAPSNATQEQLLDESLQPLARYKKRLDEVDALLLEHEFVTNNLHTYILTHLDFPADRIVSIWRTLASDNIFAPPSIIDRDYRDTFLTARQQNAERVRQEKKKTKVEVLLEDDEYLAPNLIELIDQNPTSTPAEIIEKWRTNLAKRKIGFGRSRKEEMRLNAYRHNIELLQTIAGEERSFITDDTISTGIDAGLTPEQVLERAQRGA
jgi:hypothetical protein